MALTISGSGGGITREEMVAYTGWTTLKTFNISETIPAKSSKSAGGIIALTDSFDTINGIFNYEKIRIRVVSGSYSYSGYGTSDTGCIRLWYGRAGTASNYTYQILLNAGSQIKSSSTYSKTFSANEKYLIAYKVDSDNKILTRAEATTLSLVEITGNCIGYDGWYHSGTTIQLQVVVEGKDPVTF